MLTHQEMKTWIDGATYKELLDKWRYTGIGEPFFRGETGRYYKKVMAEKRNEVGPDAAVSASKSIDNSSLEARLYLTPDQIKLAAIVAEHVLDGPDSVDKFAKELNIPVERLEAMYEALYLFLHGDGLEAGKGKG